MSSPAVLGELGESIAAGFLSGHGLRILARNIQMEEGEIDLLALDGKQRVAIEVRTRLSAADPLEAIDDRKRRHVARLGLQAGAARIDLVGVLYGQHGLDIHWLPDAL